MRLHSTPILIDYLVCQFSYQGRLPPLIETCCQKIVQQWCLKVALKHKKKKNHQPINQSNVKGLNKGNISITLLNIYKLIKQKHINDQTKPNETHQL